MQKVGGFMSIETKITDAAYVRAALPKRPKDANKSTFGRVLLVCGSGDMRGAAALSVLGALRCGAGLVTLASTREVIDALSQSIYEAMYFDIERGDLPAKAAGMNAVGFGCGLGRTDEGSVRLAALLGQSGAPLVVDADGLNLLSETPSLLKCAARPVVLTPHPLEFSRLCGKSVAEIQSDRVESALRFAKEAFNPACGGVLLLKGAGTVITDGARVFVNPTGSSALSKGGSGDTLCGMICAFIAEGASPFDAAVIAAYIHGLAAERCAKVYSDYGVLASDVAAEAAKVICVLTAGEETNE